jgi:hypothetical protein
LKSFDIQRLATAPRLVGHLVHTTDTQTGSQTSCALAFISRNTANDGAFGRDLALGSRLEQSSASLWFALEPANMMKRFAVPEPSEADWAAKIKIE